VNFTVFEQSVNLLLYFKSKEQGWASVECTFIRRCISACTCVA